jgi:hypothetical protein
LHRIILRF